MAQEWPFYKGFSMILGGGDLNSVSPASTVFRPVQPISTDTPLDSETSAYTLEGTLSGKIFQKVVIGPWV
jgi:hypothetical protein